MEKRKFFRENFTDITTQRIFIPDKNIVPITRFKTCISGIPYKKRGSFDNIIINEDFFKKLVDFLMYRYLYYSS